MPDTFNSGLQMHNLLGIFGVSVALTPAGMIDCNLLIIHSLSSGPVPSIVIARRVVAICNISRHYWTIFHLVPTVAS